MAAPLLESKLRVPRPRAQSVERERLDEMLRRSREVPLTLVCAPAGFGKTTLLGQWLTKTARETPGNAPAIAWVSLGERDNDAATFWTYLITAVQRSVGETVGAASLAMARPPQATETMLAPLLNDLDAVEVELIVVLDDYHLIEDRGIHDGVAYLLDHLPPHAHLVIATRADPPLPLARLRSRAALVEIRAAQLRFTPDEAGEYLAGPMGLTLAPADVATLAERTEGWAAALQLAGLSLQNQGDTSAAVARFAGDDRFIVDYLADEVLARQTDDDRAFLLATSVLERLSGPLCDAVTGLSGGAARLVQLERAGLFLIPLDDRRQWWRYHHLFAEVLRAHAADDDSCRLPELHRRAAVWFASNGDRAQAVEHALAAGDFTLAAEVMERSMMAMQRERREPELARWLRALPDEVLKERPVLAVGFVGVLAQVGEFASVAQRLRDIEDSLRPGGGSWPDQPPPGLVVVDEEGWRSLPSAVEMYSAALALAQGRLQDTVRHAQTALSLAPPEADLNRAAAAALGGLASWTVGDLEAARIAYGESIKGLTRAGFIADVLGCTITVGDIHQTQGHLDAALRAYRDALDLAESAPGAKPLRGTADMHVGVGGVLFERGDLGGAAEQLAASERLGEYNGLPQNPYRSRVLAASLGEAEGDLDKALALLDEAERVYNGDYSPNVRPVPATRARLWLRRGELNLAQEWARESGLTAKDELSYLREYEHLVLARLLLTQHAHGNETSLSQAIDLLKRLQAAAEAGKRTGTLVEILVVQALAHQADRDAPAALDALRQAVVLAEPAGFVRTFVDEGEPLAALLKALVKREPGLGYARRLLTAAGVAPVAVRTPSAALIEPLSERELDVLRLLATDLDGPDIARQLHVSLNTMRTHSRSIFRKLQVNNRRAAVRQALELDLIPGQRKP